MRVHTEPQPIPAKGILAVRRITNRRVADVLGRSEFYVGRVLNGREIPSSDFRRGLAAFLDEPEDDLFGDQR